jgi:hypothetical protein
MTAVPFEIRAARGIFVLGIGLAAGAALQMSFGEALAAQERAAEPRGENAGAMRPIPPETKARYERLKRVLQPTARTWVENQGRLELKRGEPDVAALRSAIQGRFAGANGPLAQSDIDAMVEIVLAEAASDQESDLQQAMSEVQAQTKAKDALRQILEEANAEAAASGGKNASARCETPRCKQLEQQIPELNQLLEHAGVRATVKIQGTMTYGQLKGAAQALQNAQNSLGDISQTSQMQLQMVMDQRTKLLEALSNIEKKQSDTSQSILANLK